ncbi:MAG TPA: hypothetical protein VJ259_02865 [Actinomycetota bacterium]|nr:hypothetical protein [Actinomycetota bacterium]
MSNVAELLERESRTVDLEPGEFERLTRRRDRKQRNRRVAAGVLGIAVFALAAVGFLRLLGSEGTPANDPTSPFEGTWVSTSDADGGTQTMTVRVFADGAAEIVVTDDIATVCSLTPSTMTGTGRIEGGTQLVIPAPVYTCDDGSEPETLSGPPLEEQLRDWTLFLDPDTHTLSDGLGGVWLREGAEEDEGESLEGLGGLEAPWDPSRFGGTWESTAADTGFLGTWESTDIDGSSLLLGIRVSEYASDGYEVLLLDGAETCPSFFGPITSDDPITMTGIGRVEGREMAIDSQTWFCEAAGGPDLVTGDASLQIAAAHTPFVHDPETDTLLGPTGRPPGAPSWMQGRGVVWHRRPPGSDPIGVPFWGVWPQSSLEEAVEAQRRADAGDPAFTWQLAPELAAPPEGETFLFPYVFPQEPAAANGAEILARFSRDVLGWERYVTVAKRDPWNSGEAGWTFVWIRCGPGTNPLYPDDPNGGDCPPTIGDTHYQTVSLMVTQPVRSGPTGIWVVAGWTELAPSEEPASDLRYHEWVTRQYEQVVPPTEAELVDGLEAFLSARVAGEGADAYLTEGFYNPRPRVPLLYATTEGHRYERFEIVSVEGPAWPAAVYQVTVRLFARGGEDVVEQEFVVWAGSRGQLTMDSRGTTENGVDP